MPDIPDIFINDLDVEVAQLRGTKEWIDSLYYQDSLAIFFNRPMLSMLSASLDFVIDNLDHMRERYLSRRE